MRAWRVNAAGVLIPAAQAAYPRPVGWDKLPADIRAEWERRWLQANAQQVKAA